MSKNSEIPALIRQFKESGKLAASDRYVVCPGFCDLHVHFREPGYSYKETIYSGSRAAAHGGYTTVCTMPNLNPFPDSFGNLKVQLDIINRDSVINIIPYGTITEKEHGERLSDMESMNDYVCGFSDDGKGVQNPEMMKKAMLKAKSLGKLIVAHCEDNGLLHGGCVHEGKWAEENGFIGISSASEYKQIERDIELVKETGSKYHVCHISTKESVELIRKAKAQGMDISAETAPHYLVLTEDDLRDEGRFKMNPPIRSRADRAALIEGIKDGTIVAIATDHAPHSAEEKSKGLRGSPFGIVGLETAFPVLYTSLVKSGVITLEKLIYLLAIEPRKRFGFEISRNDYTVFEIKTPYIIDGKDFLSMGKSSPFEGMEVYGRCLLTAVNDKIVFSEE